MPSADIRWDLECEHLILCLGHLHVHVYSPNGFCILNLYLCGWVFLMVFMSIQPALFDVVLSLSPMISLYGSVPDHHGLTTWSLESSVSWVFCWLFHTIPKTDSQIKSVWAVYTSNQVRSQFDPFLHCDPLYYYESSSFLVLLVPQPLATMNHDNTLGRIP